MTIDTWTERGEAVGMGTLHDMDEGAFADLTSATAASCTSTATGCSVVEDAEDAVQETFLKAWRARETLRGPLDGAGMAVPHRHQHLPRPDRAGAGPSRRAAGR